MTEILVRAQYNGYCKRCHFSIFRDDSVLVTLKDDNEKKKVIKTEHQDCLKVISDKFPRRFNPKMVEVYGRVERKTMRRLIEANQTL